MCARLNIDPARGSTPTRVLAVIDWLEVGGAQQHLLTLATGLDREGYQFVVATSADEPLAAAYGEAGVEVLRLERRSIKHRVSPVFTTRLVRLATSGRFHLIHAHLHSASLAAAVAARVSGLPLIVTHHSMNTWRSRWDTLLGRWADRQADAVIAVASNIAASIERGGLHAHIIRNGVPASNRTWTPAAIAAGRAGLGVPPEAYLIGFVGRFSPDKNPLLFVEASALVARECPAAHFVMIGDGALRPVAEARARALGLADRIHFAGFRPSAATLLPLVDTLALTSNSEGTPLVVLEAMMDGHPVVATAVGDVASQVVDGQTGYLVPPRDAPALASALARLADPMLRTRLGDAGRERAMRHFTAAATLAQTAALYRAVLERHAVAMAKSQSRRAAALAE